MFKIYKGKFSRKNQMENGYKLTQNHLCNSSRGVMVAHLTTDQKVLGSSPSADAFYVLYYLGYLDFEILNLSY